MPWCCSCFAKTYEAPEVLELDYRHSSLTEVPPDVFTYERTLEKLDLGCNQISDLPPSLFHCHELRELDLCDNDLMTIPPAVGSLTRLARLDLSRNAIGDIADTVKNCKNLTYLDLSLNHLQKLPEGISQLVNLEELFLNDTYLEFLPANFGRLTKLKVLELRENSLQTLPKSMNRLHSLQRIDIGQNDISELPEVIGTMTNLMELWCDNNSVRVIPKAIGNLTKLNCLDASHNEIQEISDEISKCILLSDVTLANNSLESLPDSFPKLENLTVLRLDNNSVQYLPEDFGNLKSLQELSLISNLLKSLPASVGLMRKLRTLYLDDNLLTELPKEIGSCSSLSILSIAKNRLIAIPSEVGHLNNLKVLTVAGNLLVNLPVSLFNIRELDALWLSESQSKPLLPLTKEVDPQTGQHVLTCYLLPQLPSAQPEVYTVQDEKLPPRRSRPSIKFVTDNEPPPTETNVVKRGLLRAPTPYPKELRALAKHASHLRSKDQNGDVVIHDEPEYEGDYSEQDLQQAGANGEKYGVTLLNGGMAYQPYRSEGPALPVRDYSMRDLEAESRGKYDAYNATGSSAVPGPQTPLLPATVDRILSNIEETNKRNQESAMNPYPSHQQTTTNISLIDPCPVVSDTKTGPFEDVKKGPPPYHVAAMRAAMFRTTPSSSASSSPLGLPGSVPLESSHYVNTSKPGSVGKMESEEQTHIIIEPPPLPPLASHPIMNIPAANQYASGNGKGHSIHHDVVDAKVVGESNGMSRSREAPWGVEHNNKEQASTKMSEKESRVIEEIIVSSGLHKQHQRMMVEESEELNEKKDHVEYSNLSSVLQPPPQTLSTSAVIREEMIVSDLISTIEMSLRSGKDDEGPVSSCGGGSLPKAFNGSSSKWSPPGSSEENPNTDSYKNVVNNTESYNSVTGNGMKEFLSSASSQQQAQEENNMTTTSSSSFTATSLSSTESFSKIPKFNTTSKMSAVTTCVDYKVPPTTTNSVTTSSKPPPLSTYNSISSSSSCSSNSNSPASSTNWSRIPKLPTKTGSSGSSNSEMMKKPETGPKPSLIRIPSGGKIRSSATNSEALRGSKIPGARTVTSPLTSPTGVSSSRIPRFGEQQIHQEGYKENDEQPEHSPQKLAQNYEEQSYGYRQQDLDTPKLERTLSGSRIPKFNDAFKHSGDGDSTSKTRIIEANVSVASSNEPASVTPTGLSKIPTVGGRKPWIFGTHRNARVVPVEYTKINTLGFTVTNGPVVTPSTNEGSGIYIDSVEDGDSSVKVGDKILQVDGIDVSNMGLEIVRKILSNCHENIHLLVSRHY